VDAVDEPTWRAINRPHPSPSLDAVLDGMLRFAASFTGRLVTETMLVAGVNDADACLEATAGFLEVGDLLATAAIHPLREDAALVLLERSGLDASTLRRMVCECRLRRVDDRGHAFYLHPLHDESPPRDIP
jgi:hypothetical protein